MFGLRSDRWGTEYVTVWFGLKPSEFPRGALANSYPKKSSGVFTFVKSTVWTFSGVVVFVFVFRFIADIPV